MASFRIPTVNSCCFSISLRTAVKIIGILSLVDCMSVYASSAYAIRYNIKDCKAERVACSVAVIDVALRTVYGVFVVLFLMGAYKAGNPRFLLFWIYSTLFVSLLTTFVMVPAVEKFSRGTQYLYYLFSLWDLYACLVVYSFYVDLTEGNLPEVDT